MSQALTTRNTPLTPEARAALDAGDVTTLLALNRAAYSGWFMEAEGEGDSDPAGEGDPAGDETPEDNPEDDPEGDGPEDESEDDRVKRARRQAANYRRQLRETQEQLQQVQDAQAENGNVLQALRAALTGESGEGDGEGESDPTEALAAITGERDTLRTEVSELRAELLVHNLAGENGANPTALLDSREFTRTLHGLDASADDYRDQVSQAIATAVEKNDRYAAQGQGPSRGGADGSGSGSSTPGSVTPEQFKAMSYQDRVALNRTNPALYRRLAGTV